jgi:hypothetical protein
MRKTIALAAMALLLASCHEGTNAQLVDGKQKGWSDNASLIVVETYAIYLSSDYDKLEYYTVTYDYYNYGRDIHIRTTKGEEQRTTHYYNVSFAIEFKEGEEE